MCTSTGCCLHWLRLVVSFICIPVQHTARGGRHQDMREEERGRGERRAKGEREEEGEEEGRGEEEEKL